ncbi:MAG: OB-fold nucleic acid binding domain-containing protein, partial [Candidatus Nanopelagicales bacterium]|nr:OB-fold nucleic acid binding domain-containing protein [Candidatus Nanopelagicales bacterium]
MIRDRGAGTLRLSDVDSQVTLAGWIAHRRDHGGIAFCDLRDATGRVQVVIRLEDVAREMRPESCVQVVGVVRRRPEGNENPALATGDIEVDASEVVVLSEADPLPFGVDDYAEVGEEARLKWRYLDLRRTGPARVLKLRSEANRIARD